MTLFTEAKLELFKPSLRLDAVLGNSQGTKQDRMKGLAEGAKEGRRNKSFFY